MYKYDQVDLSNYQKIYHEREAKRKNQQINLGGAERSDEANDDTLSNDINREVDLK